MAFDEHKNLYVTTSNGNLNRILKITPDTVITVFLGRPFQNVIHKDEVFSPNGIVYNFQQKTFYIADGYVGFIQAKIDGSSFCYAGCDRIYDHIDGPVSLAKFQQIGGLVSDKAGNLYFCDQNYIRKITPDGIVSTIAGSGELGKTDGPGNIASFHSPSFLAFDSKGALYISDLNGVRKIILH